MLEPKKINVEDKEFQLYPLPVMTALRLDKKVITLLMPVLKGVDGMDSEINIGEALSAFSSSLMELSDNDFEKFALDLLSKVQYLPSGEAPLELTKENMDKVFSGNITLIYKVMWEVMKYNKFTPFELMGGGFGTISTLISPLKAKNPKSNGNESAK